MVYQEVFIASLIFIVAMLYASVGHGGASGYIALLSLFTINILEIKFTALVLNIIVSGVSFYNYYRLGFFKWKLFYPFIILSIPMAYFRATISVDSGLYKKILGVCIILSVLRILGFFGNANSETTNKSPFFLSVIIGGCIGFLSGLIGIGGGIILGPVILLFNWASLKETNAVTALFIFLNSIAAILGLVSIDIPSSSHLMLWIIFALVGGAIGSFWGSKKAINSKLKYTLAIVLLIASLKLIFI